MKKIILSLSFILLFQFAKAQDTPSVEKSIYGVQIGLVGVYGYGEYKLSDPFALRTELGYDAGPMYLNGRNPRSSITFSPVLSVEPRWYYNLKRRVEKNKRIDGNTGNFLSFKISYDADFLVESTGQFSGIIPNEFSFIPTYGFRRSLGKRFNYEVGFGLGYMTANYDIPNSNVSFSDDGMVMNLYLRFGLGF